MASPLFARIELTVADDPFGHRLLRELLTSTSSEAMLENEELQMIDLSFAREKGRWMIKARVRMGCDGLRRDLLSKRLLKTGWTIEPVMTS